MTLLHWYSGKNWWRAAGEVAEKDWRNQESQRGPKYSESVNAYETSL